MYQICRHENFKKSSELLKVYDNIFKNISIIKEKKIIKKIKETLFKFYRFLVI